MGLLDFTDMMGSSFDDPKAMGLLAIANRLSTSPKFVQGLSGGLLEAGQISANAKKTKLLEQMQAMQMEQQQMALQQQRAAMARQQGIEQAYRGAIESPAQQALAQGGGPTIANATAMQGLQPRINQSALLSGLTQADPMAAYQMMQPKPADYKVVGGSLVQVGPNGVKEAYRAPSEESTDPFVRLLKQSGIDPMSPQGQQYLRQRLTKETSHQPGVSVSYGAPVAGVDAQGNPVFFQPDRAGGKPAIIPGVAPPPKETPAALREKLANNAVTLQKIDKALSLVDQKPDSFGMQNVLGDSIMQRIDEGGTDARAMVADIAGQKIHDRSGAAVTVGETQRLKPYIPNATDTPTTVKKKLAMFRSEYAAMQQAINSGASLSQAANSAGADGWSIKPMPGGN